MQVFQRDGRILRLKQSLGELGKGRCLWCDAGLPDGWKRAGGWNRACGECELQVVQVFLVIGEGVLKWV